MGGELVNSARPGNYRYRTELIILKKHVELTRAHHSIPDEGWSAGASEGCHSHFTHGIWVTRVWITWIGHCKRAGTQPCWCNYLMVGIDQMSISEEHDCSD